VLPAVCRSVAAAKPRRVTGARVGHERSSPVVTASLVPDPCARRRHGRSAAGQPIGMVMAASVGSVSLWLTERDDG